MGNNAQFRSETVASPYPVGGVLGTSTVLMNFRSKRMFFAITAHIERINKKAESG